MKNKVSGFTLLEIIIVLFIIAITVGIVGVSINSLAAKNELQPFVDIFYQRLSTLEREAILTQSEIGINIYSNKIEILRYKFDDFDQNNKKNNWKVYKTIRVPNNIKLKYEITENGLFIIDKKINIPEIIITSGGQMTPFNLIITHPEENIYYTINAKFSGELSLESKQLGA